MTYISHCGIVGYVLYDKDMADNPECDKRCGAFDDSISLFNISLLKKCRLGPAAVDSGKYIPVALDVSPLDNSGSKKEGGSWAYERHDGHSPNFAYAGVEVYMVSGSELRPGKQQLHSWRVA